MFGDLSDLKPILLQLATTSDKLLSTRRHSHLQFSRASLSSISAIVTSTISEVSDVSSKPKNLELGYFLENILPALHRKLSELPKEYESEVQNFWLNVCTFVQDMISSRVKESVPSIAPSSPKTARPKSMPASPLRVGAVHPTRAPLRVINGGNVSVSQTKKIILDRTYMDRLLRQVAAIPLPTAKPSSVLGDDQLLDLEKKTRLAEQEKYLREIGRLYRLGRVLFGEHEPIFRITFGEVPYGNQPPVLDTSIWDMLGSDYCLLENMPIAPEMVREAVLNFQIWQPDQLNISPSCLADIIARTQMLQVIKQMMGKFYGEIPVHEAPDCFRAFQILSNLNLNPCLLMWEVIREILLRSRIHILQIKPTNTFGPKGKCYYLTFAPGRDRKIQLTFKIAVTRMLFQGKIYEGFGAYLTFDMTVCVDLRNNTIFNLGYTIDYHGASSELSEIVTNLDKFDLGSSTVIEAVKYKVNSIPSYKAMDSLSDSIITNLPVAVLLPEYSPVLFDYAMQFEGDAKYQGEFERVVTTDLPRTVVIPGLGMKTAITWQCVEQFLLSQGITPRIIKAFKLQIAQGFLNPAFALWTNFFTVKLPTFYKLKLFDAKGIGGKSLKFTKNSSGEFLLELDYLIYGLEDMTNTFSTEYHQFPLFVYSVVLNLNPADVAKPWIKSAVLIATPAGNQILQEIGKASLINDALANYARYRAITDRAMDQELLIQFNRYLLPDGRMVLIRGIEPVTADRNAALRAILVQDSCVKVDIQKNRQYDISPRSVLCELATALDSPHTQLEPELVDEIQRLLLEACHYDRYWHQSKTFKKFMGNQNAKIEELKTYITTCLANEMINPELTFEILAAFSLLNKCRLHIFEEKLPDVLHTVPWIAHRSSYRKLTRIKLNDVFILRGLKTCYALKVEVLNSTQRVALLAESEC